MLLKRFPDPCMQLGSCPLHQPAPCHRFRRGCTEVQCKATVAQHSQHTPSSDTGKRRVVITGLGVVSSLGHNVEEFYGNLLDGHSGISRIESFDTEGYATQFAGEIKEFDPTGYVTKKMERRLDNTIKYTFVAGKKALESAGLAWEELGELDRARCGILVGTAMGGMHTFSTAVEALSTQGHRRMNPFCIPMAITNMGGAMLAMELGFMGPNYSINTACATGNYCMLTAAGHIQRGEADLMLAGGSEAAVIPSGIGGFIACKALSKRNSDPGAASRPWDKGRDGFVMGEGAGILLLEELEHAKARGAPILAEFAGGAFTCDAYHMTDPLPSGQGVTMCIQKAIANAGVALEDVNYVNAHATSTVVGDMAEYRAIRAALPGSHVKINSTKSMVGHLLGAAGGIEAVATVQAMKSGWLHPNLNLEDPEEELDMSVIVGSSKEQMDIKVALSNSFGFGGHNSAVLFKAYTE